MNIKKKDSELHLLNAWCLTVVDFIIEADPSSASLFSQFKNAISVSFNKQNLKGLRLIKKDLSEIITDLSSEQRQKLTNLLDSTVGMTLEDINVVANKIIAQGKINTASEYRFLTVYIDTLLESGNNEKVSEVNEILREFVELKG